MTRAVRRLARRVRAAVPERIKEVARLRLAGRLEAQARGSSDVRGAALVLHAVGPRAGAFEHEIDPAFPVDRLDALVGYLAPRYALVRARDLLAAAQARRRGEPLPVAITFDDDLPSHLEHAAPVLARHGTPGTAFVCAAPGPFWWQLLQAAVDRRRLRPGDLPPVDPRLVIDAIERVPRAILRLAAAIEELPPAERDAVAAALGGRVHGVPAPLGADGIQALADGGWEVGFHTRRHDALPLLDDDGLRAALTDGRSALGGEPSRTLAYPHGKAGRREAAAARAAGFEAAFTGRAGVVGRDTDPHLVGRLQVAPAPTGAMAVQLARALAHG